MGPHRGPENEKLPKIELRDGSIYAESISMRQQAFHDDNHKFRAIVGQVGSGKSACASAEAAYHSWCYRDNLGFILMESEPQMKLAAIPSFLEVVPTSMIWRKNITDGIFWLLNKYGAEFINGEGQNLKKSHQQARLEEIGGLSMVVFTSFQGTYKALRKWASGNVGWYMIDQAEQAGSPRIYKALNERLRRVPSGRQAWFVANLREDIPIESDWLWQLFNNDSELKLEMHSYHEFPTDANKEHLPPDFLDSLKVTLSDAEYARYVSGDKDAIQMSKPAFPDFNKAIHVVPHLDPPNRWDKGIGLDTGINNPTAFVQIARLPTNELYVFDEYQVAGEVSSVHARAICDRISTEQNYKYYGIDSVTASMRNRVTGMKEIEEYHRFNLPFIGSTRDVPAGVNRIREYLKFFDQHLNPFTQQRGSPLLFISDRCPQLIEQMQKYRVEEPKTHIGFSNQPEKFRKWDDHLVDALRFIIMLMSIARSVGSDVPAVETVPIDPKVKSPKFTDQAGNLDLSKVMDEARKPAPQQPLSKANLISPWMDGNNKERDHSIDTSMPRSEPNKSKMVSPWMGT